ncbi:lysophospholipid acyltransferase family protein [Bacteroidota bacterium]
MVILYYIFIMKAWFISRLPFRCLYFLSDVLSFFLYHVFKYRKKVVYENLNNAFPEKSHQEIVKITKQFYRNLCDVIIEVIKTGGLSADKLKSRVVIKNEEILDELFQKGKSIMALTAHIGNWEWASMVLAMRKDYQYYAVYKPLTNHIFDKYLIRLRSKYGDRDNLIPFKETYRVLVKNRNKRTCNILAADQTPTSSEISYWTSFLNQETGVFLGPEKMAKALDMAILFLNIQRTERGMYEVEIVKLFENTKDTAEYEITEKHVSFLDNVIQKQPDNWLWSHIRWKHRRDEA